MRIIKFKNCEAIILDPGDYVTTDVPCSCLEDQDDTSGPCVMCHGRGIVSERVER